MDCWTREPHHPDVPSSAAAHVMPLGLPGSASPPLTAAAVCAGGYFSTTGEDKSVLLRLKEVRIRCCSKVALQQHGLWP